MGEVWRVIPSFPLYEASSLGNVRRLGKPDPLRPNVWRTGYLQVALWAGGRGKTSKVHRLVCEAFHGPMPQPRMDAAHLNGVKGDNRPGNLRWATRRENEHDKRRHGRDNAGSRNGRARLTEAAVAEIKSRAESLPRSSGMGVRIKKGALPALAAEYGVTGAAIRNILAGTHWRCVS